MEIRTIKCHDTVFIYLHRGQHLCNTKTAVPTCWEIETVQPLQKPSQMFNTGSSHRLQYFKASVDIQYDINCPN